MQQGWRRRSSSASFIVDACMILGRYKFHASIIQEFMNDVVQGSCKFYGRVLHDIRMIHVPCTYHATVDECYLHDTCTMQASCNYEAE